EIAGRAFVTGAAALNTFHYNTVALAQVGYVRAGGGNLAAEFMARHYRVVRHAVCIIAQHSVEDLDIGRAHGNMGDADQNLARLERRNRDWFERRPTGPTNNHGRGHPVKQDVFALLTRFQWVALHSAHDDSDRFVQTLPDNLVQASGQ